MKLTIEATSEEIAGLIAKLQGQTTLNNVLLDKDNMAKEAQDYITKLQKHVLNDRALKQLAKNKVNPT